MTRFGSLVCAVGSAVAACGVLPGCGSDPPAALRVSCANVIDSTPGAPSPGFRILLGRVALPAGATQRASRSQVPRWPYWIKAGIAIRSGTPVTVSLAVGWSDRARLTWGNGLGLATAVRFANCTGTSGSWNAYAGGLYLRTPSACVPLRIHAGHSTASATAAIGRRCET